MSHAPEELAAALAGRYRIEREVGEGGMATVHLAQDLKHGRAVAIKVLRPELAAALGPERFLAEIRTTASLQHPHILSLFDSGQAGALLYYVMPFVVGESLRDRLRRQPPMGVAEARDVLREVLDGLAHAHRRSIVHRDVKPENILLSERHALIADFGVAKAVQTAGTGQMTSAGMAVGTPAYMAPEQAVADPTLDHRADLYAAAAVGYEMLTGRALFPERTPQQVVAAHIAEAPRPLRELRPDVPRALEAAIMRGLEKDPAARWQDADAFAAALADALDDAPRLTNASTGGTRAALWRRPAVLRSAVLLGAVVGIGLAVRAVRDRAADGAGAAPTSAIAVMPFTVAGGERFADLQDGLVNLLGASLDGVAGLRSVNAHALLASAGGAVPDLARARQLAERFAAGSFVMGGLVESGGQLRLSASLYRANADQPLATVTAEGPDSSLFQLVDRLGAQLVAEAALGGDPRARLATVTTSSLPALRAYLEGERRYRGGQYLAAASAFEDAVATDTGFALAFYRLSMAQERLAWADASQRTAEQALRHAARLTAHQRAFLEAVVALRRGETWRSEGMFRVLVASHPEDAEAWYQLGEIEFHGNPLRGRSMTEAAGSLRRALYYDPADLGAMYHLLRVLARRRDRDELDSLARVFAELTPSGDRTLELRALQAFVGGDSSARAGILAEVARAPDNSLPLILWSVGAFAQDIPGALEITALMRSRERPRDVQALGWLEEAHLELARGRRLAARAAVRRAAELGNADAPVAAAWMDALPVVGMPPGGTVGAAVSGPPSRPSVFFSVHDSVHRATRHYVEGLAAVRRGDAGARAAAERALEGLAGHPAMGALAAELVRGLRAHAEAEGGQAAAALRRLETADPAGWYERTFVSPFFAGANERYLRATLLEGAGRAEEALAWYEGLTQNSTRELAFLGPSLVRRAAILEQLGRPAEALPLLERFVALWNGADDELEPVMADARARLSRLRRIVSG